VLAVLIATTWTLLAALVFGAPGNGLGLSRRQWVYALWRGRRPFQGSMELGRAQLFVTIYQTETLAFGNPRLCTECGGGEGT